MELLLFGPRIIYWLFIAPIWWVATYLASYFYPFEGDTGYVILSLIISTTIIALIFWGLMTFV